MFEVRIAKQPQKYIKKAALKTRRILKICFEKLEENPFMIARPLHGDLKGKWKVKIGCRSLGIGRKLLNKVVVRPQFFLF